MTADPPEPARPGETPEPGQPTAPGVPSGGGLVPGQRPPVDRRTGPGPLAASFDGEIRAAVRYESGLVCKALAVLAVLAVILLLRALYLGLWQRTGKGSAGGRSPGQCSR